MRMNPNFELVEVANEYMLVPVGEASASFKGVVVLSEEAAYLLHQMEESKTEKDLLELLLKEYDVEPVVARKDIEKFIEVASTLGFVI